MQFKNDFLKCTVFWADCLLLYWICLCSKFPANTQTLDDFLSLSNRKFEISISSRLHFCKKIGSFIELTMQQKYHWEKGEKIRICKVDVIILHIPPKTYAELFYFVLNINIFMQSCRNHSKHSFKSTPLWEYVESTALHSTNLSQLCAA